MISCTVNDYHLRYGPMLWTLQFKWCGLGKHPQLKEIQELELESATWWVHEQARHPECVWGEHSEKEYSFCELCWDAQQPRMYLWPAPKPSVLTPQLDAGIVVSYYTNQKGGERADFLCNAEGEMWKHYYLIPI